MEYLLPLLLFVGLALIAGILLTYLSRKFPGQQTDDELKVRDALPGLNCGLCGFAGCDEYAKKAVTEKLAPNLCVPGGTAAAKAISEITGVAFQAVEEQIAFVACRGHYDVTRDKYEYKGVLSCAASSQFYGGRSSCLDGCLGFGDCAKVCAYGAITVTNGCAEIDPHKCTGCLLCARTCPKHMILPRPKNSTEFVTCSSKASGKETRLTCKNGCIACKKCERVCESGAIKVHGNTAVIEYSKCIGCGKCVESCPVGCIQRYEPCHC